MHITIAKPEVLNSWGPGLTLEGLMGGGGGGSALSCYLILILSILIQNGLNKHSRSKFRGDTYLLCPPLDLPLIIMRFHCSTKWYSYFVLAWVMITQAKDIPGEGHFMKLVITDNLSFTDKYSDILDFDWLWSTVIDCCHGNSQWMKNCQWWQVSWNAPLVSQKQQNDWFSLLWYLKIQHILISTDCLLKRMIPRSFDLFLVVLILQPFLETQSFTRERVWQSTSSYLWLKCHENEEKFDYDYVLRNDHRIKTSKPISMILVSFFSEDNVLSDEIQICYILKYQSSKNWAFHFLGDTRYKVNSA